jgi:hypothetical protein
LSVSVESPVISGRGVWIGCRSAVRRPGALH